MIEGDECNFDIRTFINVTRYPKYNNDMVIKFLRKTIK
jgi:hypothetical protein